MKVKFAFGMLVAALLAQLVVSVGMAWAHTGSPSLHTFSDGSVLTATQLNNSFGHIHNTLSGGIANTHISPTAAIAGSKLNLTGAVGTSQLQDDAVTDAKLATNAVTTTKLATNAVTGAKIQAGAVTSDKLAASARQIKAWAIVNVCATPTCVVTTGEGISNVQRSGPGIYTISLSSLPGHANVAYSVMGWNTGTGTAAHCTGSSRSATNPVTTVVCRDGSGAAVDAGLYIVVIHP
jgi:hypothetical protein